MITLVQFGISKKAPIANFSPFCLKLETYLRVTKTPYQVEVCKGDPKKEAPKGKLPFIRFNNGETLADSDLIIRNLEKENNLDGHLDEKERALGLALQRLSEDHLMWTVLYQRWLDKEDWPMTRKIFFRGIPDLLMKVISTVIQKRTFKSAWAHGIARYDEKDIYEFARIDLEAISELLGDKEFFLDDQISTYDIALFAVLANCVLAPVNPKIQRLATQHKNLVDFVDRINRKYFPERYKS
ncbi:MAG: glutathione S-transferase family protein [Oligoflexia bacterium]|nr:glutathione S-transferase family protein [Oligoflexia bacterium]